MQTFLPYASFEKSAAVLDQKRLGKQRVETLQIMAALVTHTGWVHHPATAMWRGYEFNLLEYQYAICYEWHVVRGFKDTCLRKTIDLFWSRPYLFEDRVESPSWLGSPQLHRSHKSNLLRKNLAHYGQEGWDVPDNLEYIWPE